MCQLFALAATPELGAHPGRAAIVEAMAGKVLAAGILVGTYSRGEPSGLPREFRDAVTI